ncbi:hypothetical protein LUZ61_010762 [Rhynchospora tenuis]|uniref:MIP18 family-like domain-containing protein n=1 Tax=Rhynchospora tenuis TaxID=198213 RepID=A0AAD5ZZQ2_9POAL|nr:hypothetical protein LUZ61_010762 [Rhynchospora tenuis]
MALTNWKFFFDICHFAFCGYLRSSNVTLVTYWRKEMEIFLCFVGGVDPQDFVIFALEIHYPFYLLPILPEMSEKEDIKDPEHPYSLEELKVVSEDSIEVDDKLSRVRVVFTPTVEHCSMATIIGLCIRVKLMRSLPSRFKVDILVAPGTHETEASINKQLNDKERVAAALENPNLLEIVEECLSPSYQTWT